MARFLFRVIREVDKVIAGLALAVALWILGQEMIARWFFDQSFTWTEDLSRVLLVVMVYFGVSAVTSEDGHIRVEFVLEALPPAFAKAMRLVIDLSCLAFSLTATWLGLRLVRDTANLGLTFAHSEFAMPVWVAQACIPAAFALISLRIAIRLVGRLRGVHSETGWQQEV